MMPKPAIPVVIRAIAQTAAKAFLIFITINRLSGERHRWGYENRGAFALSTILIS
jgi:hypothetical protein